MIMQENEEVKVQKDQEQIKPIWERKAKAEEDKQQNLVDPPLIKASDFEIEADPQINSFVNPKEQQIKASE